MLSYSLYPQVEGDSEECSVKAGDSICFLTKRMASVMLNAAETKELQYGTFCSRLTAYDQWPARDRITLQVLQNGGRACWSYMNGSIRKDDRCRAGLVFTICLAHIR